MPKKKETFRPKTGPEFPQNDKNLKHFPIDVGQILNNLACIEREKSISPVLGWKVVYFAHCTYTCDL